MAVLVQCDGGVGVAQQSGQRHNVHALLQGPGGERVPETVKVGSGNSCLANTSLKQILVSPGLIGLAIFLAEHIAARIVARILIAELHLDGVVILKVFEQTVHDVYCSAGVICLGALYGMNAGAGANGRIKVGQAISGFADLKRPVCHIYIFPPQAA